MIQLEEAISGAFPSVEESDADFLAAEEWPVAEGLLEVTPTPKPLSEEELEEEVGRYRRLVVHEEQGVPISVMIAIGGALLLHVMLVGLFLLGLFFLGRARLPTGGDSAGDRSGGGAGTGYMLLGDGPKGEAALAGKIPDLVAKPVLPVVSATPLKLPDLSVAPPESVPVVTPAPVAAVPPARDLIGMAMAPDPMGEVKPPPAPTPLPPAPSVVTSPPTLEVAPPTEVAPAPVKALNPGGRTAAAPRSPRGGIGDGGDENDDPVIDIMKPGSGGEGSGSGDGQGNGIDRGESGANNDEPGVLTPPVFELPGGGLEIPKKAVKVEVVVLRNGHAGEVRITQSCGIPEIDEAYKEWVKLKYVFRPAYRAGHAVDSRMTVGQSWGTE